MGARPGERRFPGRPQPTGLEVEAHSPYAPGDDLRHLDWNLLGRLDTLLMRRFTAEREVVVHLLVDASASMGLRRAAIASGGWRPSWRWRSAPSRSRAGTPCGSSVLREPAGWHAGVVHRRRAGLVEMADQLDATTPGGALDLGDVLGRYAHRHPGSRRGLGAVGLPGRARRGSSPAWARSAGTGYAVYLLQVLGRSDVDPGRVLTGGGAGRHRVRRDASDRAHGRRPDPLRRAARGAPGRPPRGGGAAARRRGASCTSDETVEHVVTTELVRAGLVRARR